MSVLNQNCPHVNKHNCVCSVIVFAIRVPSSLGQNQCQETDNINCGDNLCQTLINNLYKDKGNKYYFSFLVLLGYGFTYPYTDDGHFICNEMNMLIE